MYVRRRTGGNVCGSILTLIHIQGISLYATKFVHHWSGRPVLFASVLIPSKFRGRTLGPPPKYDTDWYTNLAYTVQCLYIQCFHPGSRTP